jgi:hypothetical protein
MRNKGFYAELNHSFSQASSAVPCGSGRPDAKAWNIRLTVPFPLGTPKRITMR